MTTDAQDLERYVTACREVLRDIQTLTDALRFQIDGGHVDYAVDFAEIYSFVKPTQSGEDALRPFSGNDPDTADVLHHAALSRIFFTLTWNRLLLLDPYAIELDDFVNALQEGALRDLAVRYATAYMELHHLSDTLTELSQQLAAACEQPQGPAFDALFEKLEKEGGHFISLLVNTSNETPSGRLASLLRRVDFAEGSDYEQDAEKLNAATIARWYDALSKRRSKQTSRIANHLDAHAIAIVERAARNAPTLARRRYLITRSRHMHDLLARERERGEWHKDGPPYTLLLDPRTFAILPQATSATVEARRQELAELEQLAASIGLFLEAYGDRDVHSAQQASPEYMTRLNQHLQESMKPWRRAAQLAGARFGDFEPENRDATRKRLVDLILTVRSNFGGWLEDRMASLLSEYKTEQQYLSVQLAALRGRETDDVEIGVNPRAGLGFSSLSVAVSVHWMPHRLEFHSPEVRQAMATHPAFWDLQNLMRRDSSPAANYERLLSLAYLLGIWRKWKLARDFCELAIAAYDQVVASGMAALAPDHESHFLRAICLRELAERNPKATAADCQEALDALDRAAASKATANPAGKEDPRYLKERALLIWRWRERLGAPGFEAPLPPSEQEAIDISERAIPLAEDLQLRSQLHNNLCFQHLQDFTLPHAREEAFRHYQALKTLVDHATFPVMWQHRDTLTWCEFKLGLTTNLQALIDAFDDLLRTESLENRDRQVIRQHKREIRDTMNERLKLAEY